MGLLLELFLTAFVALVISFIIAKLVSVVVPSSSEEKILAEKTGVEAVKLDKGLKVERAKSKKKRVKFVDDVVVKNVDHFEGSEKPIKDFQLCEDISEKVGILDKSLEAVYGFEGEGVDKESELMTCGEKLAEECGDGNMTKDVKDDDVEAKKGTAKDVGLLDETLDREVVEDKNEDTNVGEFCSEKDEDAIARGSEGVVVGEGMKTEGIGDENELILMNDGSDQNDAAAGERVDDNADFLGEALERVTFEGKSGDTSMDVDKICGGKQGNIHLRSGSLENLVVGEKVKSEEFDGEGEMKLASSDIASDQTEAGGVVSVKEDEVIGTVEELSKENEGVEAILRDENVGKNASADDDDDWEGIERSEVEKVFAEAVNYVEYGGKTKDDQLASLGSDVQMQLYGLHKLALEGPCHEPQPMAIKVSARAKWNAWQKLGSMSPEVAMEEYIKILSDNDPGWMQHSSAEDDKHGSLETGGYGSPDIKSSSLQDPQANFEVGMIKNEKAD